MLITSLSGRVIDTIDRLIEGPALEPLDLDEAKKYLRFTPTTEDTLIDTMIAAARQYFEQQTGVICITQTWEHGLSGSPSESEIELPKSPLQSIESVAYDLDGVETFMSASDYSLVNGTAAASMTGRVRLASGASWPTFTSATTAGLRIRYTAGFGDAPGDVPELIKWAIGMLLGSMHKFRAEAHEQNDGSIVTVPFGAQTVIHEYKYRNLRIAPPRYPSWG